MRVNSGAPNATCLFLIDCLPGTQILRTNSLPPLECSLMSRFFGYEVSTEGDSFLVAFHEPGDAVAFALAVQQGEIHA